MPQIWMTYAELGSLLDLSPEMARTHAMQEGFASRRSRDGLTRIKLDHRAAAMFLDKAFVERSAIRRQSEDPVHTLQQHLAVFDASTSNNHLILFDKIPIFATVA